MKTLHSFVVGKRNIISFSFVYVYRFRYDLVGTRFSNFESSWNFSNIYCTAANSVFRCRNFVTLANLFDNICTQTHTHKHATHMYMCDTRACMHTHNFLLILVVLLSCWCPQPVKIKEKIIY